MGTVAVLLQTQTDAGAPQWIMTGSGVAVAGDRVLTCAHVVAPPKGTMAIATAVLRDSDLGDGVTFDLSFLRKTSQIQRDGKRDLALLTVPNLNATPIALAGPNDVDIGDDVFFIGHPSAVTALGVVGPTVATAIISGKMNLPSGVRYLRLDGSINKGNSGGALLSRANGRLVGVVNAKVGGLGAALQGFKDAHPVNGIMLSGVDPVEAVWQTVDAMENNLQLGIGMAISEDEISAFLSSVH
jgi:S1-C subfamily serine protease